MQKGTKNAWVIFSGGILMLLGVYFKFYSWSRFILLLGGLIFIFGFVKDLK